MVRRGLSEAGSMNAQRSQTAIRTGGQAYEAPVVGSDTELAVSVGKT
jgi:hypothetical protein